MMPTARMTTRAKASANSGQPKACIRLTRCMSMTLRERISDLLSAHRGGGRGGRAVDDVVLQGHGSDLKARRPGPVRAADLGVEGRGGQRADLLERSEEHTSELQSRGHLVCRLLLEQKNRIR